MHPLTHPPPMLGLCVCSGKGKRDVAVGAVGEAGEGLQQLPGGLAWLLVCGDPGKRQEELSIHCLLHLHHNDMPLAMLSWLC